jgi:hypothetical protein
VVHLVALKWAHKGGKIMMLVAFLSGDCGTYPNLVHYQGHVISDKAFLVGLEAVLDVCWEVLVGQLAN